MCMILTSGTELACGSENDINIYGLQSGKLNFTLTGHTALVRHLHLTDKMDKLFSGSDDKVIKFL